MSGPQLRPRSGTRAAVMRALAEADGAVTSVYLAARVGISPKWAHGVLARPLRCGWVVGFAPRQVGWGPAPYKQYQITDKGRQFVASLADDTEETRP